MTVCFLNGRFFGGPDDPPLSQACISAFDAGVQHAVGLFETMLGGVRVEGIESASAHGEAEETWVLHLDEHLDRLADSARELGLASDLRTTALAQAVLETVRRSRLPRARIRLTITGGDLSLLAAARSGVESRQRADPTILIVAQPATTYPDAMFNTGVRLTLADARANPLGPFDGHKSLNYWWRLRELQLAAAKGAGEALVLSVTNHVCGGCVSNIFALKGDTLITPLARGEEGGARPSAHPSGADPLASPAPGRPASAPPCRAPSCPGSRAWIIDRAERRGLRVERRLVSVQEIVDADEVFLTNSSWGVLPIVHVEKNAIAAATPGRWTLDLRDAWLALMPETP